MCNIALINLKQNLHNKFQFLQSHTSDKAVQSNPNPILITPYHSSFLLFQLINANFIDMPFKLHPRHLLISKT